MTSKTSPRRPAARPGGLWRAPAWLLAAVLVLHGVAWAQPEPTPLSSAPSNVSPASGSPVRMPGWLVPVVRVVSDTHVVPTTGVALGGSRVLVPSEFSAGDRPLYVLDGGADLRRNGRPARPVNTLALEGLTVLDVEGLDRPAAVLAAAPLEQGDVIALLAFPPADRIAAGVGAVRALGAVTVDASGVPELAADRPLPNLTGALVNACEQWLGWSAAREPASMATGRNTVYHWLPTLSTRLQRAGAPLASAPCDRELVFPAPPSEAPQGPVTMAPEPQAEPEPDPEAPPEPEPGPVDPQEPEVESAPVAEVEEDAVEEDVDEPAAPEADANGLDSPGPGPVNTDAIEPDPGAIESATTVDAGQTEAPAGLEDHWLELLLAAGILLLGLLAGRAWGRRGRNASKPVAAPVTTPVPISGPAIDTTPVLQLLGPQGRLPVLAKAGRVDVVLGRFDADLLLAGRAVSRHHARLTGTPGDIRLVDLGSTNGSWRNGERLVQGVSVPVAPGDRLRFGDVELQVEAPEDTP